MLNKRPTEDLDNINTEYNNVTTSANSQDVPVPKETFFTLQLTLVSANTPTDLQVIVQFLDADGNYMDTQVWFWQVLKFEDTEFSSSKSLTFPGGEIGGHETMRVRVVAVGTDATNTFTVSNAKLLLNRP